MTENLPRGNFGPIPSSLPAVSWFEFLLNEDLLEKHLHQENPDPSPVQLIVQFLQQADAHVVKEPLPPIPTGDNGSIEPQEVKVFIKENKKVKALRLLALKVAAHLKWNLNTILTGVPLVMVQTLITELLKITLGCDFNTVEDRLSGDTVTEEALFSLHLYHRWCLMSVVRDSFPTRPIKQFAQMQGQFDSMVSSANEAVIRYLKERTSLSVEYLQRCLQCGRVLRMPTMQCIGIPSEDSDDSLFHWDKAVDIDPHDYQSQIQYDLGTFNFYTEAYSEALHMFTQCLDTISKLTSPQLSDIDMARLKGYHTACQTLRSVQTPQEKAKENLYQLAEQARQNDYQGLIDVLIEDNLKQELTSAYRSDLEDELGNKDDKYSEIYMQVSVCNVIRSVMEGKALVSLLADIVEDADQSTVDFLIMVLTKAMAGSSFSQKSNLKCFIWHLMDLSPVGSRFNTMVVSGELRNYFTQEELKEMNQYIKESSTLTYSDIYDDATTMCSSYPNSRVCSVMSEGEDSSVSAGTVEQQLMFMYEPESINNLTRELILKLGRSPAYVMALNEKWKVPKEMHQIIYNLAPSVEQAYVYLLIGKACHCIDVRIFERARQLLLVADRNVYEISYILSKHVRWYILLADLLQFYTTKSFGMNTTLQDLIKKTKTCITSVRLDQDIQPTMVILEHCAAFLLNIRDWQYLTNMENSGSGHIELCRLLACMCKELPTIKAARIPARALWEAVKNIFTINPSHKRSMSGRMDSAHVRDSTLAILAKELFIDFLPKIKEPMVLSVLVSCLSKFYNIIRDEISCEISSDYLPLWPTTVSNIKAMNKPGIEEAVVLLMQHVLQVNPSQPSWLRTQADIHFANGQYSPALKFYMEAGVVASDFFSSAVPKSIYDDQVYKRMIKCCSYLQCHTQVAVLCQFTDEIDYATCFKALQERNCYDAMDTYYSCIWDISILEYLVHLHSKRGEMEKKQAALKALTQLDLNSSNPEDIIQRAVQMRKRKFLRALAKQYL
ncbi:integrator complex subunit 8-like isoform X1 [Saccostrea echinata]|uniref:integrator complex subunit 8-like isoform X1 n=1 Tax=Saccostrea echinata TaxID=191078 RepID=UPI002A821A23|nr:integrator complex subunit 8-like isoform X1 [Saccostrea echinata]